MGLELCFGLLLQLVRDKEVPLERLLYALSTGPARVIGLEAPTLREGAVANAVLVDPERVWQPAQTPLQSKSRNSPFLHSSLTGRVLCTLAQGQVVFDGLEAQS
jgi:dihydroorotase